MKKIITLLTFIMVIALNICSVFADNEQYIIDQTEALTAEQELQINEKLKSFREKNNFDLVIVFTHGLAQDERMAFADDYFDYNGYGYGEKKDGALLLVNLGELNVYSENNSWISTSGAGINYIDNNAISSIGSPLTPYLLNGNYFEAANRFPDLAQKSINSYIIKKYGFIGIVALIFGFICAFVYAGSLKKQLVSVKQATEANSYMANGSLNISRSYDHFLYANVTRTKKQNNNSSSSHTSSSGNTHGGGGF